MKKKDEKYLVLRYVFGSYVKVFLGASVLLMVSFLVLLMTGLYAQLESILDLKYNSPFVFVPLFGFAVLAVLCLVIGFLMYFYKYKRPKRKSLFNRAFKNILNEVQTGGERK